MAHRQVENGTREVDSLEPIAVIGLSFRFPEDATSVEGFWDMILEKRCVSTTFPEDRINLSGIYNPDSTRHDTVCLPLIDSSHLSIV
jgi:acyl transferase domain-containing protein